MYKEDMELADLCGKLACEAHTAGQWLTENADAVGVDLHSRLVAVRKAERLLTGCQKAAKRKMCVGVFGPSQTGKSYLISAMARNQEGKLWAMLDDESRNFINEINPEGGRESTGLVTRFTVDKPGPLPPGLPVQIKLLSEIDIVKILTNTFYADAEHEGESDRAAIAAELKALEAKMLPAVQAPFDAIGMEDLQEYTYNNFRSKERVICLQRCYWEQAVKIAPYLSLTDRAELFGIIWNGLPEFMHLYKLLAQGLESMGHPEDAFCSEAALIPREKSIIDVITLNELSQGTGDLLDIQADNGRRTTLPRAVITALTAELTINMKDKPAPFFDHTDLLDFPGYRSREKLRNLAVEVQVGKILEELFLRGKVAYLFERYCAERELTSLLLCIGPSTQEVKDLPIAVNEWVNITHGGTPTLRSDKPCSLFFIFTKCDMEFDRKSGSPDVSGRWDTRLETGLLKQFGMTSDRQWPQNWDDSGPFRNIFLLRNPEYRFTAILDFEGDKEASIRKDAIDFVAELESAFLNGQLVRNHFPEPKKTWDALMSLNDGGISHIRNSLGPVCAPEIKRKQIQTSLQEILSKLVGDLKPYWRSDDNESMRQEKKLIGMTLARFFLGMAKKQHLGMFLRKLMLRDQDLFDLHMDKEYLIREKLEAANTLVTKEGTASSAPNDVDNEMITMFGDDAALVLNTSKPEESVDEPEQKGPANEAEAFRIYIEQFWLDQLHSLEADRALQQYIGLPEVELGRFIQELHTGFIRSGMRTVLDKALYNASLYANMDKSLIIWKQSTIATRIINSFVDWLGMCPTLYSAKERTISMGSKNITLFDPPQTFTGLPHMEETPEAYDQSYYTDWTYALVHMINENAEFSTNLLVNPEQNTRLKNILDNLHI